MHVESTSGGGAEVAASGVRTRSAMSATLSSLGPGLAGAGFPFLIVAYLGLRGGGYDEIVRGEAGIAAWWIVVLGAAVGALPRARLSRGGWIALGCLTAFAAWTALGIGWSESPESSVAELGRVATLLGLFALALASQGREAVSRVAAGVAAAIVLVSSIALLSRLHPSWFPKLETPDVIFDTRARLNYPLNYWNGLAAFVAMGVPLLLAFASAAKTVLARALALAATPALALTTYYTLSRGGVVEVAIALAALIALHPRRIALAAHLGVAFAGGAILIGAAAQRGELADGLTSATALDQGNTMLAMTIVVCAGVGLVGAAIAYASRYRIGPRPRIEVSRRRAAGLAGAAALVAIVAAVAAGAPARLSNGWEEFKQPVVPGADAGRFESASGSGRYQYWSAAVDANASDPVIGIGPGAYHNWWARNGTIPGVVRDAHSLFLQALAELGIVGLALILAVVLTPLAAGISRLRRSAGEQRILLAGAIASCAGFIAAAAIDWAWQLTVLPVAFLLLSAAILARPQDGPQRPSMRRSRLLLGALALAGLIAVAIPLAGTSTVRRSEAAVRSDDLPSALKLARDASGLQPYAAAPLTQEALVLELQGRFGAAAAAAQQATAKDPENWRPWVLLSRLEAERGRAQPALVAYRQAKSLNPRSPLFK